MVRYVASIFKDWYFNICPSLGKNGLYYIFNVVGVADSYSMFKHGRCFSAVCIVHI